MSSKEKQSGICWPTVHQILPIVVYLWPIHVVVSRSWTVSSMVLIYQVSLSSHLAGKSMVKRCQESEPSLISVIFFIFASPKGSDIPLIKKRQRSGKNCQSIRLDCERLNPLVAYMCKVRQQF